MTTSARLYYTDPMLTTFSSSVVRADGEGAHTRVVLESTAFYPTSGGQPFDTGTLGGAAVRDVVDDEALGVVHVVEGRLTVGSVVEGRIDWTRRFDHMQQHTGQHLLSAAFERTCQVRTESFHLGTTSCTIDLAREVSAAEIEAAESGANAVVWEDRPVTVRFVDAAEAATLPLRKESLRPGVLRLVEVDDYDLSACGGTHVPRTGMVGLIAIAGWERFKGGSRIEFVCGGRALTSHRRRRDTVTALVKQLTVAPHELPEAVARLQADSRTARKTIRTLQEQVASLIAATLAASAEDVGAFRRVLVSMPDWEAPALSALASAIVVHPGMVAVVIGHGTPAPVVVARSADVAFDAGACVKAMTAALGGRGGGRADMAQGVSADVEQMMAYVRHSVR